MLLKGDGVRFIHHTACACDGEVGCAGCNSCQRDGNAGGSFVGCNGNGAVGCRACAYCKNVGVAARHGNIGGQVGNVQMQRGGLAAKGVLIGYYCSEEYNRRGRWCRSNRCRSAYGVQRNGFVGCACATDGDGAVLFAGGRRFKRYGNGGCGYCTGGWRERGFVDGEVCACYLQSDVGGKIAARYGECGGGCVTYNYRTALN